MKPKKHIKYKPSGRSRKRKQKKRKEKKSKYIPWKYRKKLKHRKNNQGYERIIGRDNSRRCRTADRDPSGFEVFQI